MKIIPVTAITISKSQFRTELIKPILFFAHISSNSYLLLLIYSTFKEYITQKQILYRLNSNLTRVT